MKRVETSPPAQETPSQSLSNTAINPVATPDGPDLTGKTLGEFKVLRMLGQGGMGQVYQAEQLSLKRKVALKTLKPELAAREVTLKRFKAEAEAMARLTHANIVQVYFHGEQGGIHYMALEFVDGFNLREYLIKKGPPDLAKGLSIMRQVAAALQRAGEQGIAHRDIKPENIMLTRKGEVKVADFGLSKDYSGNSEPLHLTQSGVAMGTPLYMSPEQVQGKPLDPRTDIYSFGVTCYHMFAGSPPFVGQSAFDVAMKHVQSEAKPLRETRPDLPAELCAVIAKMMSKDPNQRHQTGQELVRELVKLRESMSGTLTVVPADTALLDVVPVRPSRWRRWLIGISIAFAMLIGISLGRKHAEEKQAEEEKKAALTPPAPPVDDPYVKAMREDAKLNAKPAGPRQVHDGLQPRIKLLHHFLKNDQWQEAEDYCKDLDGQALPYAELAHAGRGVILALGPNPDVKKSNEEFLALMSRDEAPHGAKFPIINHADMGEMIARAVRQNDDKGPLPDRLKPLTKPLRKPPKDPKG